MNKETIKIILKRDLMSEEIVPAISKFNQIKKENGKINKESLKDTEKEAVKYNSNLKKDKNESKMAKNKFNYDSEFEKKYHDEMETLNGLEMNQYDSTPNDEFTKRASEGIKGSKRMGNEGKIGNAQELWNASSDDFGSKLEKRIKDSAKRRGKETPAISLRGRDIQELPTKEKEDNGHKPYSINENNKIVNNKKTPDISENKMKRLTFKKEFKGLYNALKLIPEGYRVDNKVFEMTDGNEKYTIRWEGSLNEGKAIVLLAEDKKMINKEISKMKHLYNYKSEDTLGTLKGNERIDENKIFNDIWEKSKRLLKESEEMEKNISEEEDVIIQASNRKTPTELLDKLSNDKNGHVRYAVAENPNTSIKTLTKLSNDESYAIREAVAENPNTSIELLIKLSNDKYFNVTEAVAKNPKTPSEILAKLYNSQSHLVRIAVAENPNTSIDILDKLSNDDVVNVRYVIALNPNTPSEILIKLSDDEKNYVRQAVAKNPNYKKNINLKENIVENEEEEDVEVEDNFNKPSEDDDNFTEKEPTKSELSKIKIPVDKDDDDEEEVIVNKTNKVEPKLLFSQSKGDYYVDENGTMTKVPDEYLDIASDKSIKSVERAKMILKKMDSDFRK